MKIKQIKKCSKTMTGKHYFVWQIEWNGERDLDSPKECKYCGIIDDRSII